MQVLVSDPRHKLRQIVCGTLNRCDYQLAVPQRNIRASAFGRANVLCESHRNTESDTISPSGELDYHDTLHGGIRIYNDDTLDQVRRNGHPRVESS